jgi:phosphoribosylaminoimidazole (AIR) synthetase
MSPSGWGRTVTSKECTCIGKEYMPEIYKKSYDLDVATYCIGVIVSQRCVNEQYKIQVSCLEHYKTP